MFFVMSFGSSEGVIRGDGIFSLLWSTFACIYEEELSEPGTEIVHVRCVLEGDVARMYRELESRGLVKSVREAVAIQRLEPIKHI